MISVIGINQRFWKIFRILFQKIFDVERLLYYEVFSFLVWLIESLLFEILKKSKLIQNVIYLNPHNIMVILVADFLESVTPGASQVPLQDVVPQLLIEHFISMTKSDLFLSVDAEVTYYCAYSLPAVALTLGKENWHILKGTVDYLASDLQYKVRKTLASSLHELAIILGPELATEKLAPIFEGFIKDLDEVRIGVLQHLAEFFELIDPVKRNTYLPRLIDFLKTDNEWNWRFRDELGRQLVKAVGLFKPADTAKYIGVIAIGLLCDKFAAVRQIAQTLVSFCLKQNSFN